MDVDLPNPSEEAMETDPAPIPTQPELTRQNSIVDPDGDEVMQEGEGEGEEEEMYEQDIEISDDVVEIDAVEEGGDITPIEAEEEEEGDYAEAQALEVEVEGEVEAGKEIGEAAESGEAVDAEAEPEVEGVTAKGDSIKSDAPIQPTEIVAPTPAIAAESELPTTEADETVEEAETSGQTAANQAGAKSAEQEDVVEHENKDDGEVHEEAEGDNEGEEGGEEEIAEGDEEEYDLITSSNLPPILLNVPNARRALFNPFSLEDGTAPPVWFAERIEELCEGSLTDMWAAIRVQLDEEGMGNGEDEMVVVEKLMDLKMGDVSPFYPSLRLAKLPSASKVRGADNQSDVNLEDVTLLELVQMYHDCELPEPMELHVEFHPHRFITRFNAIQKELEAREVVYIEDEDIEEEEGEDVEHVEGDEEHAEVDVKADEEETEEETEQGKLSLSEPCQYELMSQSLGQG
jgi:hypothetical protein